MRNYSEEVVNQLNDLIEKHLDAQAGYEKVANETTNAYLKSFFEDKARQRKNFASELKREVYAIGGTPTQEGSFTGQMHRWLIDIRSSVTTNSQEAILEEVQRGEEASLEEYKEVMNNTNFPESTRNLLERQRNAIESAHSFAEVMEEASE